MDGLPGTTAWKSEKFDIRQRLLTIGQSYEILEEGGSLIGICTNPTAGKVKTLEITSDDSDKTPIIEIVSMDRDSAPGRESVDNFEVRDARLKEDVGRLELFRGARLKGEIELQYPGGAPLARIFKKSKALDRIGKFIPLLRNRKIHYHLKYGDSKRGELVRMRGRLGDVWRVELGPGSRHVRDAKLAVASVLVLDILR